MSNATDMLAAYQDAEKAVLRGQTYRFGERQWTMADLAAIRDGRREWARAVARENAPAGTSTGPGVRLANFSGCDA